MDWECDPGKDAANLAKHGVSLGFGVRLFDAADMLIASTIREGDEEERYKVIGIDDGRLWTAVHVYRVARVRFISVRRSNSIEQSAYDSSSS
ncbi:MAG: BrnT family toxin [Pseudomonadota bacterium]